jgi:cysteine desulfurase
MSSREVYLDHAATTPLADQVFNKMKPYFSEKFGNPSALHQLGVEAKEAIAEARETVADNFKTQPDTCFFTGSATEANNMALLGAARKYSDEGKHIITTKIEHSSVLNPLEKLEGEGFEITYLDVDENGWIDLDELEDKLREGTILVSLMYVNNEIGNVYPIQEIGRTILSHRKEYDTRFPLFHSDACQAANYFHLDVRKLHTDLLVINGSKIYGPKGVGVLYKDRDVELEPIIYGGGQEQGLRSGTENVPYIVGAAEALDKAQKNKEDEKARLYRIQQYFYNQLQDKFNSKIIPNGPKTEEGKRSPNNINISFKNIEGEKLLLYLDSEGIYCSTGSACSSNKSEGHKSVVSTISECECGSNSIRFTTGKSTTKEDIDYTLEKLDKILAKIS